MGDKPISGLAHLARWLLGLFCVVLEVVVAAVVIAGLKKDNDPKELFFWHPTMMTVGVVLFLSHGLRTYTAYSGVARNKLRFLHGVMCGLWVISGIIGLSIIVKDKNDNQYLHFSSLHSRLGLAVLFLSLMQGIIGTLKLFVITTTKKRFLSWHGRVGPLIYVLVLVTYLSGVMSVFEPGQKDSGITVFVLMSVVAVISLFLETLAQGGDLVPHKRNPEGYQPINTSDDPLA